MTSTIASAWLIEIHTPVPSCAWAAFMANEEKKRDAPVSEEKHKSVSFAPDTKPERTRVQFYSTLVVARVCLFVAVVLFAFYMYSERVDVNVDVTTPDTGQDLLPAKCRNLTEPASPRRDGRIRPPVCGDANEMLKKRLRQVLDDWSETAFRETDVPADIPLIVSDVTSVPLIQKYFDWCNEQYIQYTVESQSELVAYVAWTRLVDECLQHQYQAQVQKAPVKATRPTDRMIYYHFREFSKVLGDVGAVLVTTLFVCCALLLLLWCLVPVWNWILNNSRLFTRVRTAEREKQQ